MIYIVMAKSSRLLYLHLSITRHLIHVTRLSNSLQLSDMSYSDPLIDSISAGPDPTALRTAQSSDASSSQHPHESKPPTRRRSAKCFTTLTLPGKYDNEPLATQLWLQSRLQKDGKFAPVGTLRPFTVANTGIQLDLMRLMWPKCKEIIRSQRRRLGPSALIYLLGVVLDGVMSAAT